MRAHATYLLVTVALALAVLTPAAQSSSTASLDSQLKAAIEEAGVPGLVVIAANRQAIVYRGAFGFADVSEKRPMTTDAIFRIASMTKPITSVAAMQLYEQGRFALDDPAEKYLPDLAKLSVIDTFDHRTGAYEVRPARKPVTIRHLMTHTSGLGYPFTSATLRDFKPRDGEEYKAGPLMFEPGSQWLYGTNTDWIGRLVESLSGKNLEEYFRERILDPLRMPDTSFNVASSKQSRIVTLHMRQHDGTLVEQRPQPVRPVTQFNGGGGLFSTSSDYARFLQMLLNGGELDGARILKSETVALMAKNQIGDVRVRALKTAMPERSSDFSFVNDGRDTWGLGFLVTADHVPGKRSMGSLSWGGINNTYFWVDPGRGVAAVVLMQYLPFADPKALGVYDVFERGVYQSLVVSR